VADGAQVIHGSVGLCGDTGSVDCLSVVVSGLVTLMECRRDVRYLV
jgi:hypothetical protein